MAEIFAGLLALGFGFGLAFWICGNMLNKSNNIGDSRGDLKTYNGEVKFTSICNSMEKSAGEAYFREHATIRKDLTDKDSYEPVRRLTEEERKEHAKEMKKKNVPKGAYVSNNTRGYSSGSYNAPNWEKRLGNDI